jgi:chemotaxis protein CheX
MSAATQNMASATVEIMNPIITATLQVFETMLGCAATRREIANGQDKIPWNQVTAVIGLSGRASGSICLSMPRRTAFSAVHRMVDEQVTEVNSLVCDTVGEFANVIAGKAKDTITRLNLDLGLPNVITGDAYAIQFPTRSFPMYVTFTSEIGPFLIAFGFAFEETR